MYRKPSRRVMPWTGCAGVLRWRCSMELTQGNASPGMTPGGQERRTGLCGAAGEGGHIAVEGLRHHLDRLRHRGVDVHRLHQVSRLQAEAHGQRRLVDDV